MKNKMVNIGEGFLIGRCQVTQKQWREIMGNNPSHFKGDNLPVESVSWYDAIDFCNKLSINEGQTPVYTRSGGKVIPDWDADGYRLPTEAEWKYAAKGGNKSKGYKYSGSDDIEEVAWYTSNSGGKTHTVGTKKPNELGIYDMSGNVNEWCWDIYKDSIFCDSLRAARGGSWHDYAFCNLSTLNKYHPTYSNINSLSIRLCRSVQEVKNEHEHTEKSNSSNSEYTDNLKRKVYNIDVDGTLTIPTDYYELKKPHKVVVHRVRELYYAGNIIIIWTARQWADANKVVSFLTKNNIPYHGLMMGKGGSDYYIDDKMMSIRDFLQTKN